MRAFTLILFFLGIYMNVLATECDIKQAEANPGSVTTLLLNGSHNESKRLQKLAPKLTTLEKVVIAGYTDDKKSADAVSAIAGCNNVRTIEFRDCSLEKLPSNLRMLTQVKTFVSTTTNVKDGEQFYNAIADMPNVENVAVTGSDFRSLPNSFSRMRVMNTIVMVNLDLQLATGYDLNNKTSGELVVTDSVTFGFGADMMLLTYTCYNQEACTAHLQMFRDVLQGAFRQSNVFYTPLQGRIYRKPHPLVKPPVKGVDVYPDLYSYNAMTGTELKYGSGTKISIPAMAFEDANGSPVTGNVDITYREFRDPIDVVLSGIPMKYDSGGVVNDFQSAGMFEINASQNGTEVYLQEGKQIDIDFAVTDTASTYNFYRLDETNGWQYIENTGKVEEEMVPVNDSAVDEGWSEAMNYYAGKIGNARSVRRLGDTTSFENRYADTTYIGSDKLSRSDVFYWKDKRKRSSHLYLRRYYSGDDYTLVKFGRVKGYQGNPELNVYGAHYWKIKGKWKSQDIAREYGRKTGICDARVINEGGTYYLELKYYWGFERLEAEPVTVDHKHKPVSLKEDAADRLFGRYTKQLNRRANTVNNENKREVRKWTRSKVRAGGDSLDIYENTRKFMDQTEMELDYAGWLAYTESERERLMTEQQVAYKASGNVAQALRIGNMGIFNCDQIARLEYPAKAIVGKVKSASVAFIPFLVYVVDRARNLVFTYTGTGGGGIPVSYGSKASNQLLAIDGQGQLYMSNEDEFNGRVKAKGGDEFNGTLISTPQSTPESIRQAIFAPPVPD